MRGNLYPLSEYRPTMSREYAAARRPIPPTMEAVSVKKVVLGAHVLPYEYEFNSLWATYFPKIEKKDRVSIAFRHTISEASKYKYTIVCFVYRRMKKKEKKEDDRD